MKKLAVVALALVIAMSFVGCGLASQLEGTKWEQKQDDGSLFVEFKANDVLVWSFEYDDDVSYDSYSVEGTWTVDGDELTISEYGTATAEIDGDTLKLSGADDWYAELTRVK